MWDEIKKAPKGYPRHKEAISHQNKVGQAWKPGKVEMEGEDIFGNKKIFLVEQGLFKCRKDKCGGVVRYDIRGFAHCEICGDIYNDGVGMAQKASKRAKRNAERAFAHRCEVYK